MTIVKKTDKGTATFKWFNDDGSKMYLIEYTDKSKQNLWTNSLDVINKELEVIKPDKNQLSMF